MTVVKSNWLRSFLVIAVVLTMGTTGLLQSARGADSAHPVMAYYYGWWGDNWNKTSDVPPELYNSGSDDVMRRQIAEARRSGITAFICTWRYNCPRLLELAEEAGNFSVAFSVDPAAEESLNSRDGLVNGMREMSQLTSSPAYLRWNGKPVFVFWDSTILPGDSSVTGFQTLRNDVDPDHNQFWLGGGIDFNYLDAFDAIHFFDITWESSQGAAMASYSRKLADYNASRGANKPFVATVMPGYDDIDYRDGHYRDRQDGRYYRASWDTAVGYNAQAVVITSWNEWYEGSQIEPSVTYGNQYLDITREAIAKYRVQPGQFADSNFERTWSREDRAVSDGDAVRSWIWGYARSEDRYEPYDGQSRLVQYFDKARMEINDPNADRSSLWFVTNGLLAKELMTGQLQVGDDKYEGHAPAQVNVAGDTSDPNGPTYASFNNVRDYGATPTGWHIIQRIDRVGAVTVDQEMAGYDVTADYHVPETDHTVASIFWDFMNSQGLVYQDGQWTTSRLFADPFYAVGFPITEAYWTRVNVAGQERDVLAQCFERRCLTYTPSNPDGWKVEMGNVGQHYHQWRYGWSW